MRQRELTRLIESLRHLTYAQRQKVVAELAARERQAASVAIVEGRVGVKPNCPHCGGEHVVRNGAAHGLQRYKCRGCRKKTFNALTATSLARLRMKGKWLEQTAVLRDGVTITHAAETLGAAHSTAFRWRHRFLALPKTIQANSLVGIAETDETYFLQSFEGERKGLTRAARKCGGSAAKRGTSKEQIPVLVTRDRAGSTANAFQPSFSLLLVASAPPQVWFPRLARLRR